MYKKILLFCLIITLLVSLAVVCVSANESSTFVFTSCEHFTIAEKYTIINSSEHGVTTICTSCGLELAYATEKHEMDSSGFCRLCNYECQHRYGLNGKCSICGAICSHNSTRILYSCGNGSHTYVYSCNVCNSILSLSPISIPVNNYYKQIDSSTHRQIIECSYCHEVTYSLTSEHTFVDGVCSVCGIKCSHKYVNGLCEYCGCICSHSFINSTDKCDIGEHVYYDYCDICYCYLTQDIPYETYYTYRGYDNGKHYSYKKCIACNEIIDYALESHHYVNGRCTDCSTVCTHNYVEGSLYCYYCGIDCDHKNIIKSVTRFDGDDYDSLLIICQDCDNVLKESWLPDTSVVNYINYSPLKYGNADMGWNCEQCFNYGDGNELPFMRYTIKDYSASNNYNAGIKLIVKSDMAVPLNQSRYILINIRKNKIAQCQFYLSGEGFSNNLSSQFFFIDTKWGYTDVPKVPDNEWVTMVFDIGSLTTYDSSNLGHYNIDEKTDNLYVNFVFQSISKADSYVDVRYVALCDDLKQVDVVVSGFDNFYGKGQVLPGETSNYYLWYYEQNGETVKHVTNTHLFKDGKCEYCGYVCPHSKKVTVPIWNHWACGYQTNCSICDVKRIDVEYFPHIFVEGSNECSRPDCGWVCNHNYVNGICSNCFYECHHKYDNGSFRCSFCSFYNKQHFDNDNTLALGLVTSIFTAQQLTFTKMLDYDIFGINIASLVLSLIVLGVAIWIYTKVGKR